MAVADRRTAVEELSALLSGFKDTLRDVSRRYTGLIIAISRGVWTAVSYEDLAANTNHLVAGGPIEFGGLLVFQGAAPVTVTVHDLQHAGEEATIRNRKGIARAAPFDGYTNFPVFMRNGIVIRADQSDAEITVFYRSVMRDMSEI